MTQLEAARKGQVTPQMEQVAREEQVDAEFIRQGIANGNIVIPCNKNHANLKPCGIGKGLRTKVNANIGTSSDFGTIASEIEKLNAAVESGADTIMDLSTSADLVGTRRAVMKNSRVPVGTVPVYQAAIQAIQKRGAIVSMTVEDIFDAIVDHAKDGVDFITVHCGVTRSAIAALKSQGRVTDVVSRGGAFLIGWMLHNDKENPLFEYYDRLLEIAREYDITLSLGDGMRPGCIADATDRAQIEELVILGGLVERAWKAGVQVMVEGPGHIPLHQIEANIKLQKSICKGAPFYVLGPLVTDIGAGYDHITAAIGGAVAAAAGADFLCYVTPTEHLGLPDVGDVIDGVIASRIAGHAADIAKGVKGAAEWDKAMAVARKKLDWETQAKLTLRPEYSRQVHAKHASDSSACSMCGKYCAMKVVGEYLNVTTERC
ncbi:MAG TPA: phosphomethylpyrimidine synthase ThiC [Dehalococcoidales bacterium]|nr:phosphomethylpyrimidine synthase ThiC [Dehalococcoidales bacterium]